MAILNLCMQAMEEIVHAAHAMDSSPAVKALIITGEGPKYFAAGADIKEMADQTYQEVSTKPPDSYIDSCMIMKPQVAANMHLGDSTSLYRLSAE